MSDTTTIATDTPPPRPPRGAALFYSNKPKTFYVFRDKSHTIVTGCGAHVRATSEGVPIPRVRMSKKDRKRARQRAKDAQAKLDGLMSASRGREPEVRRLYVEKLNEFVASYKREPNELEQQALVVVAIEALPPVAELQPTEPNP